MHSHKCAIHALRNDYRDYYNGVFIFHKKRKKEIYRKSISNNNIKSNCMKIKAIIRREMKNMFECLNWRW